MPNLDQEPEANYAEIARTIVRTIDVTDIGYEDLIELKRALLDAWPSARDGLPYDLARWDEALERVTYLIHKKSEQLFDAGEVEWEALGIIPDWDAVLVDGIDVSDRDTALIGDVEVPRVQLKRIDELPNSMPFPVHNGRERSCYRVTYTKDFIIGHEEVNYTGFAYWKAVPK